RIASKLGIRAYDERNHRGVLRHIMVRTGQRTNETMIVLVTRTEKLPHKDALIKELTETYPHVKSIIQNVNPERTNVILGKKTNPPRGKEYIYDTIGDKKFAISAKSFYQVNPDQTEKLYEQALEYAEIDSNDLSLMPIAGLEPYHYF